ncbi:phage tail terminator family protein [Paenibacillus phocaensis]|uniref:phage tail terminator family protein n=1 Tax=Paenibacillus phocaensis TaxID=1776378 RepID=UPI000839D0F6|nr:hypothetical protein [Paenibacillus phocaensis]
MTLNDVVQSVASALTARFPELPVYTERSSEPLPAPSLFVQLSKSEQKREMNRRFKRTYSLDVQFVPSGDSSRASANDMAEQLYGLFADVAAAEGLTHGAGMSAEWKEDGTLHLDLTFTQIVWSPAGEVVKMGMLRQEGEIKHGV